MFLYPDFSGLRVHKRPSTKSLVGVAIGATLVLTVIEVGNKAFQDTPSIDYGQSQFFKSHVILLSHNIPAFENLTNLDQLPKTGFEVVALPMKIKGGSGAPLRIIALVTE